MSEACGALCTVKGEPIALRGVDIRVQVLDAASRTTVIQHYENTEEAPVEAVYSFPLEESSAVCGFEVEIGRRTIKGRVEEKEAAFEKYDDAMADGHGAFLLDQDRPNIFTASVGNLEPGQQAAVKISYVAELDQSGDEIRLMIPTTISPRYIPPDMAAQAAQADPSELDHINPPVILGRTPYGLRLNVEIETTGKIKAVQSPSHPIAVELKEKGASVKLSHAKTRLDQDFVLTIQMAEPHKPRVCLARDEEGQTVGMIDFFPDFFGCSAGPQEVIFILDCSYSMSGESIAQAKAALLLCLRSLEEGDYFNIFRFGSSYETMFDKSSPYNQANLEVATEKIGRIHADLGGTEIMRPLEAALSGKRKMATSIMLLTDGQVGNEKEIIDLAAKKHGDARIFTFGIGRGASEHLIRGLARATGGAAEFIFPGERIQAKVLKQLSRSRSPYFNEIDVDWGGLKPDWVAPYRIGSIFQGDRVTVYGRFDQIAATNVVLKAKAGDTEQRWEVPINPAAVSEYDFIPALFARKAIRDLEERSSALHRAGSRQRKRKEKKVDEAKLELSLRYQIMSSVASMVAIEEKEDPVTQEARLRRIPVNLTRGWGGIVEDADDDDLSFLRMQSIDDFACKSSELACEDQDEDDAMFTEFCLELDEEPPPLRSVSEIDLSDAPETLDSKTGPGDLLMELTMEQKADGSWALTEQLAEAVEVEFAVLKKAAARLAAENDLDETAASDIVATLVAIHVLKTKLSALQEEWALLCAKAEKWVAQWAAKAPSPANDLEQWIEGVA